MLVNQRDTAPAYAAMEPRQYRASGMSVSEGRNGGDAKAYTVELVKQQMVEPIKFRPETPEPQTSFYLAF